MTQESPKVTDRFRPRTWTKAKSECGMHENFPPEAQRMFLRRYNSVMKQNDDPSIAKSRGVSFVKTRYRKVKGKWQLRQKS